MPTVNFTALEMGGGNKERGKNHGRTRSLLSASYDRKGTAKQSLEQSLEVVGLGESLAKSKAKSKQQARLKIGLSAQMKSPHHWQDQNNKVDDHFSNVYEDIKYIAESAGVFNDSNPRHVHAMKPKQTFSLS